MRSPEAICRERSGLPVSETPDGILQSLAFQRGVLELLKENDPNNFLINKALQELDTLIGQLF